MITCFHSNGRRNKDAIILSEMIARMPRCVQMPEGPDRKFIVELYLHGKSERQMSKETGVQQRTINYRKAKSRLN